VNCSVPNHTVPLELRGQLGPRSFGRVTTLLLALCGALLVWRGARLVGRWLMGRRVTAFITLAEPGLHVSLRTTLLGKVTHERQLLLALPHLLRVERVVRYSGFAVYVGLITLALGSFLGAHLIVESARGGPLSLLGVGSLLIALGLFLDFVLVTGFDSARGKCRLRLVTDDGVRLEIDRLDPPLVDALLHQLKARLAQLGQPTGPLDQAQVQPRAEKAPGFAQAGP
jgi:hypothetical protein